MDNSLKTGKLPKAFKNKWLKALRSGEYKQAKRALKREIQEDGQGIQYGYCCLGVAAEIAGCKIPIEKAGWIAGGRKDLNAKAVKGYTKVPKLLQENGFIPKLLSNLNDIDNYDFKRIADWIEKNI